MLDNDRARQQLYLAIFDAREALGMCRKCGIPPGLHGGPDCQKCTVIE